MQRLIQITKFVGLFQPFPIIVSTGSQDDSQDLDYRFRDKSSLKVTVIVRKITLPRDVRFLPGIYLLFQGPFSTQRIEEQNTADRISRKRNHDETGW